jgi:hypothetical protein
MVNPRHAIERIIAFDESLTCNPAVHHCYLAAQQAAQAILEEDPDDTLQALWNATNSYCNAMPSLAGHENIRNFIACVAQGMLLGVIYYDEAPKLLYAAQVALSVLPREPRNPVGRPPNREKMG